MQDIEYSFGEAIAIMEKNSRILFYSTVELRNAYYFMRDSGHGMRFKCFYRNTYYDQKSFSSDIILGKWKIYSIGN